MLIRQGLSGRVQPIVAQYLGEPATCCMCSRPPRQMDETFLNLGVELEFFGFLYLCGDCSVEIGESVGSLPYEQHQHLKDTVLALENANASLHKKIDYLRGLLDARIDLAGGSEPDGDEPVGFSLLEVEPESDELDSIINGIESEPVESGKD
jgi:hypothetical protein